MTEYDKQIRIEALVESFFEGDTSCSEENELYDYFSSDDIPPALEQYRSFFRYVDRKMPEALTAASSTALPYPRRRRSVGAWISAAAVGLLVATAAIGFQKMRATDNRFAGSYIVRNGVRITDPKIIGPELEAAIRMLEEQDLRISIEDRKREVYEEAISGFADEEVREVMRSKLYIR